MWLMLSGIIFSFAIQLLIGFLLAALIGYAALRASALSPSGAAAAALTGCFIFGLGGLPWAVGLLTFFISSSALSRLFARRKQAVNEKFAKGSRRDWGQVLANGGLGALLAIAYTLVSPYGWAADLPHSLVSFQSTWPWAAFLGAMAAVNADTWATELGVLSGAPPRLITSGQPVDRGTSGGVSLAGTLAALGGAAFVAALGGLFSWRGDLSFSQALLLAGGVTLAGLGGSLFDSLLGATLQSIYWCPVCQKETERHPRHLCGAATTPLRGLRWLNNDWVNFGCSLAGAGLALLFFSMIR